MSTHQVKKLDFSGQVFYIGIDTHLKSWKVHIRNNQLTLKKFSMDPSPVKLYKYMSDNYPNGIYRSVYEAGFGGYWIHRELVKLGIENIIVNPADVPTSNKEKNQKSDKIDSAKLARELEKNELEGIYIPTEEQEALRSVSRLRRKIVKRETQLKCRIKSFCYYHGIKIPERDELYHWSKPFINYLHLIDFKQNHNKYYFDCLLDELDYQRKRKLNTLKKIRLIYRSNKQIQYIKSVIGIGLLTAFTIYAELMDINRFPHLDHLASMVGLIPSVDSSGEKETIKGITNRHNKHLRYMLVEVAWIAVREDPALTHAFNKLCKRMSKQKAIIKITKKLLNRIRYVWKNNTNYVPAVIK